MTDKATILALAERVEKAEGADRELECDVFAALNPDLKPVRNAKGTFYDPGMISELAASKYITKGVHIVQRYTHSLDAAMTLVPEGWVVGEMSWWPHSKSATCHMDNMHKLKACSGAVSLPLALTAASLRAHASQK